MLHRDRRALARHLAGATRGAELRYVQDLRGVVRGLHRAIAASVDGHLVDMSLHRSDAKDGPIDAAIRKANKIGVGNANFLREGMRDLTHHRGAFEGATPAEVRAIATGAAPARNSGQVLPPITVAVEGNELHLRDGRHRLQAAQEAGATHISAVVKTRTRAGVEVEKRTTLPIAAAVDATITFPKAGVLDMGAVLTHFTKQVPGKVGPLFDRMAAKVDRQNREVYETLIPIRLGDVGVKTSIAAAREANILLVEEAGRAYAQDVRDVMGDPANFGRRVEDLRDELLARGGVSESHAALIARDQVLKLNGQITRARQESAGVGEYVWSTSRDIRVRDTHEALEGTRQSWDAPPAVGHPGDDFQCRCVAVPWIAELDG